MAAKSRKSKQVILLFFCPESGRKEGALLPCPHCKITIIKRSNNESAVSAAAYQSGEKLFSEYDQEQKYYPYKTEVTHKESQGHAGNHGEGRLPQQHEQLPDRVPVRPAPVRGGCL